jgi:hypothetical protein
MNQLRLRKIKNLKEERKKIIEEEIKKDADREEQFKRERDDGAFNTINSWNRTYTIWFAIIAVIATIFWLGWYFGWFENILKPGCLNEYGRICNDKGDCINGVCQCRDFYSGPSCSDTLIPGYIEATGQECSGNGNAYIKGDPPPDCVDSWVSPECRQFVGLTQINIEERGQLAVSAVVNIPRCVCDPGWGGVDCKKPGCLTDENGYVCGNHGNRSVGLLNNATNSGTGCQCTTPVSFSDEAILSQFSPAMQLLAKTTYFYFFNQQYCGTIVATDVQDVFLVIQNPDDHLCYCNKKYTGPVCTEGRCPINPQNNEICYGNGHPNYGANLLRNVTEIPKDGVCSPICQDNTKLCQTGEQENKKCVYDNGKDNLNFFISSSYLQRCFDNMLYLFAATFKESVAFL